MTLTDINTSVILEIRMRRMQRGLHVYQLTTNTLQLHTISDSAGASRLNKLEIIQTVHLDTYQSVILLTSPSGLSTGPNLVLIHKR